MEDDAATKLSTLESPFSTRDAVEAGITAYVLRMLTAAGKVRRLQRGWYEHPADVPDEQNWERVHRRHLEQAELALKAHPRHALSHQTAALAYGWPVSIHPRTPVHLTALDVQPRSRRESGRCLHHSDSVVNGAGVVNGMRVLEPPRTAADCLRGMSVPHGIAVVDGAVRMGATTLQQVSTVLESQCRWRGRPKALEALALVNPRRETWLESFSFVTLHGLGVELPTPQVEVCDSAGRLLGRVDGMWIRRGVFAEADGKGKYLLGSDDAYDPDPESAALRAVAEQKREGNILRLGLECVRWGTDEVRHDPREVAHRVTETFRFGDLSRFRGRLRVDGQWLDLSRFRRSQTA